AAAARSTAAKLARRRTERTIGTVTILSHTSRSEEGPDSGPSPKRAFVPKDRDLRGSRVLEHLPDRRRVHRGLADADTRGVEERVRDRCADSDRGRLARPGQRPAGVESGRIARLDVRAEVTGGDERGLVRMDVDERDLRSVLDAQDRVRDPVQA